MAAPFQPLLHGPHPPVAAQGPAGQAFVRHVLTGQYLVATPEEWVRQNLLLHLLALGYPAGRIATERLVRVGRLRRRFDVLVYDADGVPYLVAECKAPDVPLGLQAQAQAAAYNQTLAARYVLLTNGRVMEVYAYEGGTYTALPALPGPPEGS